MLSTAESDCVPKLISKADIVKQNLDEIVNPSFRRSKTFIDAEYETNFDALNR